MEFIKENLSYEISKQLSLLNENSDMSDVGNVIGIIVAEYFSSTKLGFEKEDFLSGINHGISLVDGTHF